MRSRISCPQSPGRYYAQSNLGHLIDFYSVPPPESCKWADSVSAQHVPSPLPRLAAWLAGYLQSHKARNV